MSLENDIHWQPAWRLRALVASGESSAEEITRLLLERIARHDGGIHSFLTVAGDMALAEARAVDRRIAAGEKLGPLAGVPVTIKDQFFTRGLRTTSGSTGRVEGHGHCPGERADRVGGNLGRILQGGDDVLTKLAHCTLAPG